MEIRSPRTAEHAPIRSLLAANALPVEDLDVADVAFIVAVRDGDVLGSVGVEPFGSVGLLRSLCVNDAARGEGLGSRLVEAIEADARSRGLRQLVLLTQTAGRFFAGRGYVAIARADAPVAVQRSAEFRSICPASAICMTKSLESA